MTILFFGDVVGKIGRLALAQTLPKLKKKYAPDLTVINAENLAHGAGITGKVIEQMSEAGVDLFTSGNHVWDKKEAFALLADKNLKNKILRPANYPPGLPGQGSITVNIGAYQILFINLVGRVFFSENFDCPFRTLDQILKKYQKQKPAAIIIDFHAEATSEKTALGWYADGRVTAVFGTHSHIPTADWQLLPRGTAYVSDIGMTGAKDSVIGADKKNVLKNFLLQVKQPLAVPANGACLLNAVLLKIDAKKGLAAAIKKIHQEVII